MIEVLALLSGPLASTLAILHYLGVPVDKVWKQIQKWRQPEPELNVGVVVGGAQYEDQYREFKQNFVESRREKRRK